MIGMIAAVSQNNVLGVNNQIPWMGKYPEDLKRFKNITQNTTVIMGRKTWQSIGEKPLPKRYNIIISKNLRLDNPLVCVADSLESAIDLAKKQEKDIWIIGGASIYEQSMNFVDYIDLTIIPEYIQSKDAVYFPNIYKNNFVLDKKIISENNLLHEFYKKLL